MRTEDIKADLLRKAGGTLTAPEAARMLGTDVVTLQELAAEEAIIALPLPGGTAYPACQLEISGMVTGLSEALRSMPIRSPWMRLEWLLSGDPALGGAAPIEALRRGNVTEVIQLARLHGAG
ncbi:hypothetical protein HPT29_004825 [Microvirga terrae]|uniref:Rv2175c C-terminal domain-containing protein n=2 Tax=Microvirga TaxID=186650 RepID=A0ABY5RWY2_9HYPH|nr:MULTISPECIES: Rv2175c family DNA-binding protein [Microvirga]UVF20469.1 hypothetical protein HPT29_004825 [Microvirga terrae]